MPAYNPWRPSRDRPSKPIPEPCRGPVFPRRPTALHYDRHEVGNNDMSHFYIVARDRKTDQWCCSCPAWTRTTPRTPCKHIDRVMSWLTSNPMTHRWISKTLLPERRNRLCRVLENPGGKGKTVEFDDGHRVRFYQRCVKKIS